MLQANCPYSCLQRLQGSAATVYIKQHVCVSDTVLRRKRSTSALATYELYGLRTCHATQKCATAHVQVLHQRPMMIHQCPQTEGLE